MSKSRKLKYPILVYIIAAAFIIAPFGNIALSLKDLNISDWYTPEKIWLGFKHSPIWDQAWLFLDIITGFLLLNPRKYTWTLALITLSISTGFNFYNGFLIGPYSLFSLSALASTLSAGVILYYFRYPYLDRRESWWGVSPRFPVSLSAKLKLDGKEHLGVVNNISRSGAFFVEQEQNDPSINLSANAELILNDLKISTKIERRSDNGYGLSFASKLNKATLETLIQKGKTPLK